jgi:hypothetical protein
MITRRQSPRRRQWVAKSASTVLAEVLPENKALEVRRLQDEGSLLAWSVTGSTTRPPSPRPTSASLYRLRDRCGH